MVCVVSGESGRRGARVKCKKGVLKPCKCDKANNDGALLHLKCNIANKDGPSLHLRGYGVWPREFLGLRCCAPPPPRLPSFGEARLKPKFCDR